MYLRLKERKANLVAERAYFGRNLQPARLGIRPAAVLPGRGHPGGSFPTIRKRSVSVPPGRRLPPPSASFLLTWPGFVLYL